MLDSETKRRLDTCRDILVGKVPDPKSQVEQITIALIYKFMDDMDAEAEELGGKRAFFTGEFARYGWSKLMAPGLGGHEMLSLYAEAIQRMNENPGIPTLFRDVFKNAFLPYRDPETLRSFLKEINSFTYDHSERLGDAFEYLLSVLGSQGEAGQFRTPRHIIDFMVEIIDPKKDEAILDPACGTAGFLISSFKHILKHNSKGYREEQDREAYDEKGVPIEELPIDNPMRYSGDLLTPDDRKRIAANICGYDISPDMVRLSLVNMYLHGFTDPHIEEYDTLTSDEKWSELADVILANPPFMSPKGGIRPHNRFAVQSKRSEVLFVDYIAEHLTPNGRAAVVVPEGIIFQSQTAYQQLREMLVKKYLAAVISLPTGVFNPYSGVKTSILVMDKRLAKQHDAVLFVKIENDGFNLGAQRRPIAKNDLPEAVRIVKAFLQHGEVAERNNMLAVSREQIRENGDWNLSGERYRTNEASQTAYNMVSLGDSATFTVVSGGTPKSSEESYWNGGVHWATLVDLPASDFVSEIKGTERTLSEEGLASSSAKLLPVGTVLVSTRATIGRVGIARVPLATNQGFKNVVIKDDSKAIPEYVAYMMKKLAPEMQAMATGGTFKEISKSTVSSLKIPLPSLEMQKEIVSEITGYQKIIEGARQVVENYQPHIPTYPEWPMVNLKDVAYFQEGPGILAKDFTESGVPLVRLAGLGKKEVSLEGCNFVSQELADSKWDHFKLAKGDIVVSTSASFGRPAVVGDEAAGAIFYTGIIRFRPKIPELDGGYLKIYLGSPEFLRQGEALASGAVIKHFGPTHLKQMKMVLPPIDKQREIVARLNDELELIDVNNKLIRRFEDKIKQAINRVWGEAE